MELKKGEWFVILFNLIYILAFAIYYISIKNYEFLGYVAVLIFFFILIAATIKKSGFDYITLWGLSIWGLLHMAGGGIKIGNGVLYKLQLIPFITNGEMTILKYDQFVHFFGFAVTALVIYHLLKHYLNEKTNYKVIYFIVITSSMGLGALNEIVEFIISLNIANTGVGGYINNSLDLVFNTLGAISAAIFIHFYYRKRQGASIKSDIKKSKK